MLANRRAQKGEDSWRSDQGDLDQEQVRKDREQGCVGASEEELGRQRIEEVGRCLQTGAQGVGHQRLLCSRRKERAGEGSVRQGQGNSRQVKLGGSWSMGNESSIQTAAWFGSRSRLLRAWMVHGVSTSS